MYMHIRVHQFIFAENGFLMLSFDASTLLRMCTDHQRNVRSFGIHLEAFGTNLNDRTILSNESGVDTEIDRLKRP